MSNPTESDLGSAWRRLALVRQVSAQIVGIVDLDMLLGKVANLIHDTFDYYYVALFLLEPDGDTLHCLACVGPQHATPGQDATQGAFEVTLGQGIVGHVAKTGTEILAGDVTREPHYRAMDSLPETRSEAALPVKIGERVLGVLDVESDQPNSFHETDLLVLRALADNIAIAVEHARLLGSHRKRADQLSITAEISRAVASVLDLDELLSRVVEIIHRQLGYPFVHLFTIDPVQRRLIYRAGSGLRSQALCAEGLSCDLDDPRGIISWTARHGETVVANDVSREPRYRPTDLEPAQTSAEMAMPLVCAGEVLGVLDLQSDLPDAFSEDDRSLLSALTDSVAIAIRNANLYRSERWRRRVADSLREVAGLLSADVVLEEVLDAILIELERTLPCDVAVIWLLENDDLRTAAIRGTGIDIGLEDLPPSVNAWIAESLTAEQPTIRVASSTSEPLGDALGFPLDHSAIAAPLRAGAQPLGLLALAHRSPNRYGAESQLIMSTFASYAAVAIENARLYQTSQEQALISSVMLQVAEAAQSLDTLDQVLETVVHLVPKLAGVSRCAILLWDGAASAFVPAAAYGLDSDQRSLLDRSRFAPDQEPLFGDLRTGGSPVMICDVSADPRLSETTILPAIGFDSLLLLPLLSHTDVLGAMMIDCQDAQLGFDGVDSLLDERLAIIQGIALQAAAAVENTRLREAQQEEAYVSAALLQVAQIVTSMGDLGDILGAIVRITPILVGVERCGVFLWDGEHSLFRLAQVYGVSREAEAALVSRPYSPHEFPLLADVRDRDGLVIHAIGAPSEEEKPSVPADFASGFLSDLGSVPCFLLAIPLSVQGSVLGVMVLEEAVTASSSQERRLEIITGIAHQAAMAVQNERLQRERVGRERLERELQLAREIQQAFIPTSLPHLPDWDLAAVWRAAREVSGDFYDFFDLPGGRLGIVVADVADKGMPAALFMALTRTLMRATAPQEMSPAAVLGRVNDTLVPDAQHGMFVTAFYAVLTWETGELSYASAGHNLPMVLRCRTGEIEELSKGGMALGVVEGIHLQEHVIHLDHGDCVAFYTDGVTEAFSPEGEIYGLHHLRDVLQQTETSTPARSILEAVDSSVRSFAGGLPQSDDLTLVVLCRLPEGVGETPALQS